MKASLFDLSHSIGLLFENEDKKKNYHERALKELLSGESPLHIVFQGEKRHLKVTILQAKVEEV